jgi:PAS domain S-box-containing protein
MTTLTPVAVFDRNWRMPRPVREGAAPKVALDQGALGEAVSEGRVLIIPDLAAAASQTGPLPPELPVGAASLMALPLVARQQIMGTMLLVSLTPQAFGQEQTRTLTILCDHAASALVNVRLIDQLGEINERLLASELEAHQAKEHLQYTLDAASDLIIIADQKGLITYANHAADEMGLDREKLMGRPLEGLFREQSRAADAFASPGRSDDELELIADDGRNFNTLVSSTPLPASGEVLAIVRDVTQRKALERQLMHAEKLASVGILAAGVAHEIGNPLSAVSGYAQLLVKDTVADPERIEFAQAIAEQTERIDRIIRDLLDYSRPSPYLGQEVDVNAAIEAVLNMFFTPKRLARENITIVREFASDPPLATIDRDQLQQVVLNIAMNAAQAMSDTGGELEIATGSDSKGVFIKFSDNGPGMSTEVMERIFDPFYTTKPVGQGTGLGLSICDRIITRAGGRLSVRSEPGQGATFMVRLPLANPNNQ